MKKGNGIGATAVRSAQDWSGLVVEWRRSQQITREFCQARGLSVKTFQWWRWALESRGRHPHQRPPCRQDETSSPATCAAVQTVQAAVPAFIEVVQRAAGPATERRTSGVEVVLAGVRAERRVRIDADFDAATLRRIVSLLEEV